MCLELFSNPEVIDDPNYNILSPITSAEIDKIKTKLPKYIPPFSNICVTRHIHNKTDECKVHFASTSKYFKYSYWLYFADKNLNNLHRKDYPALIQIYENYVLTMSYYENGMAHRLNGPQEYNFNSNQMLTNKTYRINGELHRDDGPARISYYDNFLSNNKLTKSLEVYYQHDKLHRLDGPAYTKYSMFGDKTDEKWYKDNALHRLDGPALIMYKGDKTTRNIYYINDKKLDKTKLPYFMNGELVGPMRLNKNSILRASLFDREYGAFLKEKYDAMLKSK